MSELQPLGTEIGGRIPSVRTLVPNLGPGLHSPVLLWWTVHSGGPRPYLEHLLGIPPYNKAQRVVPCTDLMLAPFHV